MPKVTSLEVEVKDNSSIMMVSAFLDASPFPTYQEIHKLYPEAQDSVLVDKDNKKNTAKIPVILPNNLKYTISVLDSEKSGNWIAFSLPLRALQVLSLELLCVFKKLSFGLQYDHLKTLMYRFTENNLQLTANLFTYNLSKIPEDDVLCDAVTILNAQIAPVLSTEQKNFACQEAVNLLIERRFFNCAKLLLTHISDAVIFGKLKNQIESEINHDLINSVPVLSSDQKFERLSAALPQLMRSDPQLASKLASEFTGYGMGHVIEVGGEEVDLAKVDEKTQMQLLTLLKDANDNRAMHPAFTAAKLEPLKRALEAKKKKSKDNVCRQTRTYSIE